MSRSPPIRNHNRHEAVILTQVNWTQFPWTKSCCLHTSGYLLHKLLSQHKVLSRHKPLSRHKLLSALSRSFPLSVEKIDMGCGLVRRHLVSHLQRTHSMIPRKPAKRSSHQRSHALLLEMMRPLLARFEAERAY